MRFLFSEQAIFSLFDQFCLAWSMQILTYWNPWQSDPCQINGSWKEASSWLLKECGWQHRWGCIIRLEDLSHLTLRLLKLFLQPPLAQCWPHTLPCLPSRAYMAWQNTMHRDTEQEVGAPSLLGDAAAAMTIPSYVTCRTACGCCTWMHVLLWKCRYPEQATSGFSKACEGWNVFHKNAATLCFTLTIVRVFFACLQVMWLKAHLCTQRSPEAHEPGHRKAPPTWSPPSWNSTKPQQRDERHVMACTSNWNSTAASGPSTSSRQQLRRLGYKGSCWANWAHHASTCMFSLGDLHPAQPEWGARRGCWFCPSPCVSLSVFLSVFSPWLAVYICM